METIVDVKDLLTKLVAIDSVSSRSNRPMVDLLSATLAPLGFALERQASGSGKENLVARLGPLGEGKGKGGLALVGHTDTVPYDEAWAEALTLIEKDGKLYGRGACDTKAFIACAVSAAAQVSAKDLKVPLWLVFTADEEVGCLGAKVLERSQAVQPAQAIVGEPTQLQPIRGGKGYCLADVVVRGAEGHSAYPDRGASALRGARLFLDELDRVDEQLRQESDEGKKRGFVPPYTTLNVGLFQAGKAKNITPGEARFTVEWRPVPGQSPSRVRAALSVIAATVRRRLPRLEVQVTVQREDFGFSTDEGTALVKFLETASGRQSATVPFGTEAPSLIALGAETVVFGPGDIRVAHQTGEFVPIEALTRCQEILGRAIAHFCGESGEAQTSGGPGDR